MYDMRAAKHHSDAVRFIGPDTAVPVEFADCLRSSVPSRAFPECTSCSCEAQALVAVNPSKDGLSPEGTSLPGGILSRGWESAFHISSQ